VQFQLRIYYNGAAHSCDIQTSRAYANQAGAVFSNLWDGKVRMGLQASTLWQDFRGVETVLKRKKRGRTEQKSRLTKRMAKGIYRPRKP
jgi:hypothetical protein